MEITRGAGLDQFTYVFDYSGTDPIYIGMAPTGQSKASAVWQIRKLSYDGSGNITDIQFANGSRNFDQVWNDRASLSYS